MGERAARRAQGQMDNYVRSVASADSGADQIAKGKQLLDAGTITQSESTNPKPKHSRRSLRRKPLAWASVISPDGF